MDKLDLARYILSAVFAIGGMLAFIGAVTGGEWLLGNRDVKALVGKRHRRAVQAVYAILGLAIVAMAVALIL
ncbi:MAG: hypothetical protein LIO90_10815 [Bacteroidales bacterium]|nr:hypothetical protein [Bacteroidales bacterium]